MIDDLLPLTPEEAKSAILDLLASARSAASEPTSPLRLLGGASTRLSPFLRKRRWYKALVYYQGFQRGYYDSSDSLDFQIIDTDSLDPDEASLLLTRNVLKPFVKTVLKEWVRSQPRLSAVAVKDSERGRMAARFATKLVQYVQQRSLKEDEKQLEGLYAILTGNYFRYIRVQPTPSGVVWGVEVVSPLNIDLHPISTSLYDSPFVLYSRRLPQVTITRLWGVEFEENGNPFYERDVTEAWFVPEALPEELKSLAPDGLKVVECEGNILELKAESKNAVWIHGKYDVNSDGPWGLGAEDTLEMQELINELQSLLVQNALHNSSPKLVYNPRLLDGENITNNPAEMIPLSPQATPETPPEQAFSVIPPVQMSGEVGALFQSAYESMRESLGAFPVIQGVGDSRAKTATATAILRDASLALLGPALAIKSQVEQDFCLKMLGLIKQYVPLEALSGFIGDYSTVEAAVFYGSALSDIEIVAAQGSWFPRSDVEIRQDFLEYVASGFLSPEIPDEIKDYALSLYNLPVQLEDFEPDRRVAAIRLDKLRGLCERIETEVDLSNAQIASALVDYAVGAVGVEPDIDDHVKIAAYYIRWLKTDAGLSASPFVRECVKALVKLHAQYAQSTGQLRTDQSAPTSPTSPQAQESSLSGSAVPSTDELLSRLPSKPHLTQADQLVGQSQSDSQSSNQAEVINR